MIARHNESMTLPTVPVPMLPLLALDTATERIALGVQVGGRSFTRQALGGAAASMQLLPLIHALLAEAGIGLRELAAFTGLRTACSVAQGLGFGLGRPLLPLDSLMLVAEDTRATPAEALDVAVAMDARMDEVYAARYRWRPEAGRWAVLAEPALFTLPALVAAWQGLPPHRAAGSALAAFGGRLVLPAGWVRQEQESDRASALLRVALQAAASQPPLDAADALPLYLRDKVALTTRERQAARAGAAAAALPASAP
jgi:tRNA threonylcarbamoyladenosine biosynthesis protein TsaB